MNCYVYELIHVETKTVFYIGRGTWRKRGRHRYRKHLWSAKTGSSLPVHKKIREILGAGGSVTYRNIVDKLTLAQAKKIEQQTIANIGLDNLTNMLPGGDNHPWKRFRKNTWRQMDETWKDNISKAAKKRAIYLKHYDMGEELNFESLHAAARAFKVHVNNIYNAARKITKGFRGYAVSYTPFDHQPIRPPSGIGNNQFTKRISSLEVNANN